MADVVYDLFNGSTILPQWTLDHANGGAASVAAGALTMSNTSTTGSRARMLSTPVAVADGGAFSVDLSSASDFSFGAVLREGSSGFFPSLYITNGVWAAAWKNSAGAYSVQVSGPTIASRQRARLVRVGANVQAQTWDSVGAEWVLLHTFTSSDGFGWNFTWAAVQGELLTSDAAGVPGPSTTVILQVGLSPTLSVFDHYTLSDPNTNWVPDVVLSPIIIEAIAVGGGPYVGTLPNDPLTGTPVTVATVSDTTVGFAVTGTLTRPFVVTSTQRATFNDLVPVSSVGQLATPTLQLGTPTDTPTQRLQPITIIPGAAWPSGVLTQLQSRRGVAAYTNDGAPALTSGLLTPARESLSYTLDVRGIAQHGGSPPDSLPSAAVTVTVPALVVLPVITGIAPLSGLAGTVVTLSGTGFTGATLVTLGGVACAFSVVNDTTITATIPPGVS